MGFQRVRHDCTTKHAQLWYHVYRMECQDLRFERKQAPHNEGLEHYSGMQTLSYATLLNKTFPLQGINDNNAKRNEDVFQKRYRDHRAGSDLFQLEGGGVSLEETFMEEKEFELSLKDWVRF